MALSKYFVNMYKFFLYNKHENYENMVEIFILSIGLWAQEAILLRYAPRDTRCIDFPQVDG